MSNNLIRIGSAVGIRPEHVEPYRKLHQNVWPEVKQSLAERNIQNYSIFYLEQLNVMFSYSEYTGTDRDADNRKQQEDPRVQEWLQTCRQYQTPLLNGRNMGKVWQPLPMFFHQD
ncbi:L-rhamnose mutarotase [Pacificibacter marinus]|uniref:L-rhamnose mutarotase n=1 Tax=Pacificibacter marinus TaxID=658057 RepID=UPI001C079659|nr:L-rhamnose mutarotase [Pacificibacter marinus]MBU2867639.1 L-rhamnose mutarotase [Pacificibacter marinus]